MEENQNNIIDQIQKQNSAEEQRRLQKAIKAEKRQFEEDFYRELRELGFRINNSTQLDPSKFNYDIRIIPIFKKYLEKAESTKSYTHKGAFANYIGMMLECIANKKMKDMTAFLIEHYKFAIKNNATGPILFGYASTIRKISDKRYIDEYFSLFSDEYIISSSACLLGLFNEFKVKEAEDLLIRLMEHRDEPRWKDHKEAFYGLGMHLWICMTSIVVLGKLKCKKALPYIEEYLEPEKKIDRGDPKYFTAKDYDRYLKETKKIAQKAIDSINSEK